MPWQGPFRSIQVDQPVPGLGVKFNAVVALLQHLDQLAGVGMVMAGVEHADVVADVDAADVGDQGFVGGRVADAAFVERLVFRVHPDDVETTGDASPIVVDEFFRAQIASVGCGRRGSQRSTC